MGPTASGRMGAILGCLESVLLAPVEMIATAR
jgi:hypothetical protein